MKLAALGCRALAFPDLTTVCSQPAGDCKECAKRIAAAIISAAGGKRRQRRHLTASKRCSNRFVRHVNVAQQGLLLFRFTIAAADEAGDELSGPDLQ